MKMKTLVFGASVNPYKYSYLAIQRLLHHGYEVIAFGKRQGKVENVTVETELIPYENIHTLTLYMNPNNQKMYYEYLVSLKPQRIIFNPGTENPEFYNILQQAGIDYEVACTLVMLSTNQY